MKKADLRSLHGRFFCSKHPFYKAILRPRAKCHVCKLLFENRGTVPMGKR